MADLSIYELLAMDVYSRGYQIKTNGDAGGLSDLPTTVGTNVGDAEIIWTSASLGAGVDSDNSFYAIAYRIDGEVVLAFRGTDDTVGTANDTETGWPIATGDYSASQCVLALQSYNAVAALRRVGGS